MPLVLYIPIDPTYNKPCTLKDYPKTVSMMAWINDGNQQFTAVPLATTPTHLIVAKAADLDQDGIPEIVTGGLHAYPPYGNLSRVMIWRQKRP